MTQPQCTAMTRGSKGTVRCRKHAMFGTTVCKKHGGPLALSSRGPANVNWKDGRHSKVWNDAQLLERYREHLGDADVLAHRDEIAVLDALLDDAISSIGLDAGTGERLWSQAHDLMTEFEIALRNRDPEGQQAAFVRLREVVRTGQHDAESRRETRQLIRERSALAEKETRRQLAYKHTLTAEQATILFHGILNEINECVTNSADRARLNNRLMRLAGSV